MFLAALASASLTAVLTPILRRLAARSGVVDDPATDPTRKIHARPIPLLGGLAIFLAVVFVTLFFLHVVPVLGTDFLVPSQLYAMLAAGGIIMIGGYFDDRYRVRPQVSITFPILAAIVVIASGVGVNFITNPLGGVWRLDALKITLFSWQGVTYWFTVGADLFAFLWLMGMMYTTKLLDGLDGLVSGVTAIAAAVIALLCLAPPVLQPDTAILAAIVAGAFVGFLPYNWNPATIFLGEGGSVLAGFLLGVMAIIAGGKIATTLLVVGIPVLDVVWVLSRRAFFEHRPITSGDRKHLHYRLRDSGLTTRQTVMFYYVTALAFGFVALRLHSYQKLLAGAALVITMVIVAVFAVRFTNKNHD